MNIKTVLFEAIQFSISTQFSSIWSIDRSLSGATTPSPSGPWSDGNKGVLGIPVSSRVTETSPFSVISRTHVGEVLPLCRDAVGVFYSPSRLGHSLGEAYPSAETQSVNSKAQAYWTTRWGSLTSPQRCSRCILQPQPDGPY